METANPSLIAGVFRDQVKANKAMDELKQGGFREDQIKSTAYKMILLLGYVIPLPSTPSRPRDCQNHPVSHVKASAFRAIASTAVNLTRHNASSWLTASIFKDGNRTRSKRRS